MDEKYKGDKILELWSTYAVNRNNFIERLIRKSMSSVNAGSLRILEIGAGKGEFIDRFKSDNNIETCAVESDDGYRKILSLNHRVFSQMEEAPGLFDFIFLIDVLEHLEDDKKYLETFYRFLKKDGVLFLYVPARMELYSSFDKSIGHYRRYNKKELVTKVSSAGFHINKCRYHEMLGYFASAFNNRILKNSEPSVMSLKLYDKILVPVTNSLESVINPPFGKSLYLSARK